MCVRVSGSHSLTAASLAASYLISYLFVLVPAGRTSVRIRRCSVVTWIYIYMLAYVYIKTRVYRVGLWSAICTNSVCLCRSLPHSTVQFFPEVLPQVQPELPEECRQSARHATLSGEYPHKGCTLRPPLIISIPFVHRW